MRINTYSGASGTMKTTLRALLAVASLVPVHAHAVVVTYANESVFASTTGATLQAVPNRSDVSAIVSTGGVLTITPASTGNLYSGTSSGFNTVNYVGKSGTESFNIAANSTIYAFGLNFYESSSSAYAGCNTTCFDTTFTLTLFASDATSLGSFTIQPKNDAFDFYGFWSSTPIARIEIRDVTNTVDNEFIGRFFTSTRAYSPPSSPVPEPGSLALLALGLVGLGARRRRSLA